MGDKPESELYVRLKRQACDAIGIEHEGIRLPADTSEQKLINSIISLASSPPVSGIIIQLPLPPHFDLARVLRFIPPAKDVDGLHPFNVGCMALKNHHPFFESCTPLGVIELIKRTGITDLAGKRICLIGRSNIVGMPLNLMLTQTHNACVMMCHSGTTESNLKKCVHEAEIVIAAAGVMNLVKADWLGEN